MRLFLTIVLAMFCAAALTGCGKKSQARQNEAKLIDQMFSEMERLATSLEAGDKAAVDSSFEKLTSLGNRMRTEKRTKTEDAEFEQQQGKLALIMQTRLVEAMTKAAKGGNFSQADLQSIAMQFKTFGESIKPKG